MKDHPELHRIQPLPTALNVELNRPAPAFDFMPLVGAVFLRWRQLLMIALLCGLTSLLAGLAFFRPSYSTSVQLSRYDSPIASEDYRPQSYDTGLLFGLIASPDTLQKSRAKPSSSAPVSQLPGSLALTMDRNSTIITIKATSTSAAEAVALANHIGAESVQFTRNLQQQEAQEAALQHERQLADNDADRIKVRQQLSEIEAQRSQAQLIQMLPNPNPSKPAIAQTTPPRGAHLYERVQAAREQLDELQTRFTDAHPLVREQKARLATLTSQLPTVPSPGGAVTSADTAALPGAYPPAPNVANQSSGYDALAMKLSHLENRHTTLITRQRALQPFLQNPPGYLRQLEPATLSSVTKKQSAPWVVALTLVGGLVGIAALVGVIVLRELLDDRVKTGADLERISGLPLLGTLGDLEGMKSEDKAHWALRSWTTLRGRLSAAPGQGLVCGFTSANGGEGRSTWIELLAGAARQCGFSVLVVSADNSTGPTTDLSTTSRSSGTLSAPTWGTPEFTAMLVANPIRLAEKYAQPQLLPSDSLPLPSDWIWDLERRNQWQRAMSTWRTIDNLVILVDLPPMASPESMLLVENMTNLVWLTESHRAEAGETIEHLETLRHARSHLIGAVLNRAPDAAAKPRFARWFGRRSLLLATAFGLAGAPAAAQTTTTGPATGFPPASSTASFAILDTPQRAPWQQRFTLGPGDQLQLNVYGQADSTSSTILIGPDGRISYLEAQNLMAAGLTVDEFRAELNRALGKFRNSPEIIVRPASYHSKRYYVLGAVVKKGAFPLSRPLTIIEAVSQAQGLETRVIDRSLVMQADLPNSFISRQGRRLPVDFQKLFAEGDLAQNISLEPDDYLYFPPTERLQIYVLGEVRYPGGLITSGRTGTLEAIAIRGGFSERAWPKRLLVIRGSLKKPQTFIVNANDILAAKSPDFQLQPKDIVYVGNRPWYKAEELLDLAASAFIQSAVVTKTGLSVTPIGTR
ncbi:MAG: polysaccharide biosynthesis/export family protein [Opitutus sp.]|nr:polysaccharide biosynthesis/export family protein [Opitutus sp.]MCS6247104.1 polysaccharide biosynthesis/export family protein [Opitutus sp.]MCS6273470.1 polysaccharide biosynthesis/export family protein [Opitutus sp.]MCS6300921.1 polysaccharide biosynthesis/export family protein [Opitutus sp.]